MKKIDFHIHTVPVGDKDSNFTFDISKFHEYISTTQLDAVAITNHNQFDLSQFNELCRVRQNTSVFPGIEIDFEDGHLLLIGEDKNLDDFDNKCKLVTDELKCVNKITVNKLIEIFGDLNNYLLIPHYDKKPKVNQMAISSLGSYIFAGEVQSPKKFSRVIKELDSLTPVLFTDVRISEDLNLEKYQGRHTYIKTNSNILTMSVIKSCLQDKSKVFLSNSGKHDFFQIFNNGQELASGLNIVVGGRSSGKTFLLNKLRQIYDNEEKSIKYIKQFDLVKDDEKKFNKKVEKDKSAIREDYLKEFRAVVDNIIGMDRITTNYKLEKYVETLLDFASSEKLHDEFSKAFLFKETAYQIRSGEENELIGLLIAVKLLSENNTYKSIVNKYFSKSILLDLFNDLSKKYKKLLEMRIKKEWVNDLIKDIRQQLERKTSSPKIDDYGMDFYKIKLEVESIKRFNAIANSVKEEKVIKQDLIFNKFIIKAVASPYDGAQSLHDESGKQIPFTNAFNKYNSPFDFLGKLKELEALDKSELYRYFCRVNYKVLNEYNKEVSGGEMAEFNLLRALQDARQYEMLLIDEPESSFDNLFLKKNVNTEIKEISKEMPVVVVTHNNTVGMLMKPDYILYTERKIINGNDKYNIFSGSPGDNKFNNVENSEFIDSYETLLDTLEAGEEAYDARKELYNNFKEI